MSILLTYFLTDKKEFRDIIKEMLDKRPDNRITSSKAVSLLVNFTQTTVKKVRKLCLNYYLIIIIIVPFRNLTRCLSQGPRHLVHLIGS